VTNIVLGVVSSAVSAALAWLAQALLRQRRAERTRRFLGLRHGGDCLLVTPRHMSGAERSVSRRDLLALMELGTLVRESGARPEVLGHDEVGQELGARTEFCVGGPAANARAAAHLRALLPGARFHACEDTSPSPLEIGDRRYEGSRNSGYALLARITAGSGGRPTFLISGQLAFANLAATRYLAAERDRLARRYGTDADFCLLLRVSQTDIYGADLVEFVADVTEPATRRERAGEGGGGHGGGEAAGPAIPAPASAESGPPA